MPIGLRKNELRDKQKGILQGGVCTLVRCRLQISFKYFKKEERRYVKSQVRIWKARYVRRKLLDR